MSRTTRSRTVIALGSAQTLAWGSSYYVPAVLATPMARDLGVAASTVFAAFSAALVLAAFVGPVAGRAIDRRGGRPVLMLTNGLFALGLFTLAAARDVPDLFLAWAVLGLAMGSGLYEAAFAALVRLYREDSRGAITGITLIAGFASTIAWPLSAALDAQIGWRGTCQVWAVLHLLLGLPLNASLPRAPAVRAHDAPVAARAGGSDAPGESARLRFTGALLAYVFAVAWFIAAAMATHLPRLLEATGATVAMAVAAGALIGPAQVAARLFEFGVLRHVSPMVSARLAALAHPAGVLLLMGFGAGGSAVFAILHGAGNGILTIAKGTLPLAIFGPEGYGARQGWLTLPSRISQACAPLAFGLALEHLGAGAAWLSGALALSAFVALLLIPMPAAAHGAGARARTPA